MGNTPQPRDEGPRPRRPCGSLLCQAPVPGDPPRGRRVRGRHDAQASSLQDARRAGQDEDSYQSAPYVPYADDAQPRDAQASGSNAYSAPHASAGPDHVDYGAYTGGYGAFGWYTDHPVLLTGH